MLAPITTLAVVLVGRPVAILPMLAALHGPPQVEHIGFLGRSHERAGQSEESHTRKVLQQLLATELVPQLVLQQLLALPQSVPLV